MNIKKNKSNYYKSKAYISVMQNVILGICSYADIEFNDLDVREKIQNVSTKLINSLYEFNTNNINYNSIHDAEKELKNLFLNADTKLTKDINKMLDELRDQRVKFLIFVTQFLYLFLTYENGAFNVKSLTSVNSSIQYILKNEKLILNYKKVINKLIDRIDKSDNVNIRSIV